MNRQHFLATLSQPEPPADLPPILAALWWDAKGNWAQAHALVDELETPDAMAVHAYLHRKEGQEWNADYWYRRAGRQFHCPTLNEEWTALMEAFTES